MRGQLTIEFLFCLTIYLSILSLFIISLSEIKGIEKSSKNISLSITVDHLNYLYSLETINNRKIKYKITEKGCKIVKPFIFCGKVSKRIYFCEEEYEELS